MKGWSDLRAPALAGVAFALAFPPVQLAPAPFLALAPWIWHVGRQESGRAGRLRAARSGYLFGVVSSGLLLHWLAVALWPDPWAIPAYCATVLLLAAIPALAACAMHAARERLRIPLWLGAAVSWTAGEWLLARPAPLPFPWLGLGTSLASHPTLAAAADLVGARGLAFVVAAANGLVATALAAAGRRRATALAGAAGLVLALAMYGAWRTRAIELVPVARIAAVQTDLARDAARDRRLLLDANLGALDSLTVAIGSEADLVVWPEVAVPVVLDHPAEAPWLRRLREVAARAGAPLLVGAYAGGERVAVPGGAAGGPGGAALAGAPAVPVHNAAFVVGAGGAPPDAHLKRRLVPFIERVPWWVPRRLAIAAGASPRYGGLEPGPPVRPVRIGGVSIGVLICYEAAFGELARRHRLAGAALLVNITNDAWLAPGRFRTVGAWQHALHARMRAIETRMGVVRVANRGFTYFVDPLGRVHDAAPPGRPAAIQGIAYTTGNPTPYVRWGDRVGAGAALLAAIFLVAGAIGGDHGAGPAVAIGAGGGTAPRRYGLTTKSGPSSGTSR